MRRVTKAVMAAIALAGAVTALSVPANAQSVGFGVTIGDPYAGGYYGPDPYAAPPPPPPPAYDPYAYGYGPEYDPYAACYTYDYYNPPWGYPPDYCNYQVWFEPIYVGGLWYDGPVYYRTFGGFREYWLNGGWHRDEWRGARPAHIDWGRNMRWNGPLVHGRGFAGGG